jgi:circadian clock protein KaiB
MAGGVIMTELSSFEPNVHKQRVTYRLILFMAGEEPNSIEARRNLETFCNAQLADRYELQVVNVFEDYSMALKYRVLVTPCLVMLEPLPSVMLAGTLQSNEKVRAALRLTRSLPDE